RRKSGSRPSTNFPANCTSGNIITTEYTERHGIGFPCRSVYSAVAHLPRISTVPLPAVPVAQSPEDKFREYLASRSRPQRYTGQQRDLVRHVFAQHNHFDAEILIEDLKKAGLRVSRATVYRTLNKLVDAGMLRRLEFGPRTFFEHDYGYPQHEHLVCQKCGRGIEVQNPGGYGGLAEV